MPMGLSNAPAMFQAFMNHIVWDMTDIFVVIYLNDILIFSNSLEDHQVHIRCILEHLHEYDLHSKPKKCLFHTQKIEFLGVMVTPTGISMDTAKTDTVSVWPTLTNLKAVQAFLGFTNFYHNSLWGSLTSSSPVKNTGQIVIQCSGRNTQSCNKITTWTNSNYVKVIMSLMKDKSSMKYSLQCSGRNTEAESETTI